MSTFLSEQIITLQRKCNVNGNYDYKIKKTMMEMMIPEVEEKKIKRAAANVNERRRMQNINSGFESLREMIDIQDSSKLSKSAILRHTVEMVRNLMSENQQLREQNAFMRNLYCNYGPSTNNIPLIPTQPPKLSYNKKDNNVEYTDEELESPSKKIKTIKTNEGVDDSLLAAEYTVHPLPMVVKSPKKYPPRVSKLLESPKRMTRSSVIQQNHAYSTLPTLYPMMESPNRRSLRLLEKDILTPPSSSDFMQFTPTTTTTDSVQTDIYSSPTTRSRITFEQKMNGFLTPESFKGIPIRSAKRSLDAIIQAIDQIEKS